MFWRMGFSLTLQSMFAFLWSPKSFDMNVPWHSVDLPRTEYRSDSLPLIGSLGVEELSPEGVYNEVTQPVVHCGYLYKAPAMTKLAVTKKSREGKYEGGAGPTTSCGRTGLGSDKWSLPCRISESVVLPGEVSSVLWEWQEFGARGEGRNGRSDVIGRQQNICTSQSRLLKQVFGGLSLFSFQVARVLFHFIW